MSNVNENEISTPLTTDENRSSDYSPIQSRMMRRQNTSRPKATATDPEPLQVYVNKVDFKAESSGKHEEEHSKTLSNSCIGLWCSYVGSKMKYLWASGGGILLIFIGISCIVYAISI